MRRLSSFLLPSFHLPILQFKIVDDDPIFKPRFFAPGRQQAVAFWLFSWFCYPWSVARKVWCGEGWSPKHPKDILTFDPPIGWKTTMQLVGASLTSVNHPSHLPRFSHFLMQSVSSTLGKGEERCGETLTP